MTLDTYKLHKLVAKEFDKLYRDHRAKWNKMVQKAAESVRECVPANESIRAGDVIATVEHGIRVSREFDHHLAVKKLTQQYWAIRFAEYIVEQNYPHAEIKIRNPGGN
jgi:lipoate-protein ligase A